MCGTMYSSLKSLNTLNYRRIMTHRASESIYCTTKRHDLSHLTKLTRSKRAGAADMIRKFSNRQIPFESNRTANSNSKLRRSLNSVVSIIQ